MKNTPTLLNHYKALWFFNFHRFENENYKAMREYFAGILISEIEEFSSLRGKKVLDVGGARGEFCRVISQMRDCQAFNLDPSPQKSNKSEFLWHNTKIASADKIPFEKEEFDLVICKSVLEHIPQNKQQLSLNEMFRVTKKGGLCYIAIPPWFNPFAGHSVKPFHYFPFFLARLLSSSIYRKKINAKNYAGIDLYPITYSKMLKMISQSGFKILKTKDMHFRLHFLTRIPVAREVLVPSVAFILRKQTKE